MNISNWPSVRLCTLFITIAFYFYGLSPIFGVCQINCVSSLEISLDQTGNSLILPYLFIIDSDECTGQKEVLIMSASGIIVNSNTLNCEHNGQTLVVKITDVENQVSCWSNLTVTDNSPPKIINCIDQEVYCNTGIAIDEIGKPSFEDNCGIEFSAYFSDEVIEQSCDPFFTKIINRTWFVSDAEGNQAIPCIQQIYIKPIGIGDIQLPTDLTIENCASPDTTPEATGFPSFEGSEIEDSFCELSVIHSDFIVPLCGNTFKILRTWTISDWCTDAEISHNQTIKIVDIESPILQCNGDTLSYDITDQHSCFTDVSSIEIEVIDNCNDFTIEYDWEFSNQASQVPLGVFPITAIVTDECNNQSTCDFYIQTLDQQAPIAICESNLQVFLDGSGNYILDAIFLNGSSTDNCMISDFMVSNEQGFFDSINLDCDELGRTTTVSLMVIDESGNTGICSAQISVLDNILPEIECPLDVTIKCYEDALDLTLTKNAVSTDNCVDYSPTFSDNPDLNICNAGTITRTFSVFENEIEVNCQQLITLEVDTPSVIFPLDITIDCGESDYLEIVGQPIVSAMCPGFIVDKNDEVEVDSSCNIITTRIWKVIDYCLDTTYRSKQIITEIDTIPPVLIEPATNELIECAAGDLAQLEMWLESNGGAIALDNCSAVTWENDFQSFNFECANTGSTTVIFTATDLCGNATSTTGSFSIADTMNPIFSVAPSNTVLACEINFQQEIDNYLLTNGGAIVTDQCSDVQVVSELIGNIDSLCSTIEVLTTATDVCGNINTASSFITILDETAPQFETDPMSIEILCESGDIETQVRDWIANNAGAVAVDLCGTITWTSDFDFVLPQCGTPIPVIFTVTDNCGNSDSRVAAYTVIDNIAPTIIDPAQEVTFECDGFGNTMDIENYLANNGFSTAMDNCSDITWTNDFLDIDDLCAATGTAVVNFTATDICGNTSTTTGAFTIIDSTPPTVLIPVEELVVECDGFGNILEFNNWIQSNGNIVVDDICGEVEFAFDFNTLVNTCANAGSVFTVFVASDVCGNKTNIFTNFVIEDTTPPTVNCPNDLIVMDEDLDCTEFIILPPTTAIDFCNSILVFSYEIDYNSDGVIDIADNGPNASGDYPVGIHTIDYFVEDECGNIGFCQQMIEVVDETGTSIGCVDEFLLAIDETGVASLNPESIGMISECLNGTTSISQSEFSCDDCGMNEITFTFTDSDGNQTTCISNVFVCDSGNNCETCVPCNALAVGGIISTENDIKVADVTINVDGTNAEITTNDKGAYAFEGRFNNNYVIAPYKNDDLTNGVTTLDLIGIQNHILGKSFLDSPYQKIAADANNSGSITTLDIVDIQRVILQVSDGFPNNTSWRFLERAVNFIEPNNPFTTIFPEVISINELNTPSGNNDFVGVKIGDINQSFVANSENVATRVNQTISLTIQDQLIDKDEVIEIPIELNNPISMKGYQFSLGFDPTLFEFMAISNFGLEEMSAYNFGLSKIKEGVLLTNWVNPTEAKSANGVNSIFTIQLKAKNTTRLRGNLWIQDDLLSNEVYIQDSAKEIDLYQFELKYNQENQVGEINRTQLFQNAPNPFTTATRIKFYLPERSFVDLSIHDIAGKVVWSQQGDFTAGNNEVMIYGSDLGNEGIYMFSLNTPSGNETIKLVYISNF